MTEHHGNDEHHPELGYQQNKGGHLHVFTHFLDAYARDRHTVPTTRQRYASPRRLSGSGSGPLLRGVVRGTPTAPSSARGMQAGGPMPCSHIRRSALWHAAILYGRPHATWPKNVRPSSHAGLYGSMRAGSRYFSQ